MKSIYEITKADFLSEMWLYNINFLGIFFICTDNCIERHYIFESHRKKWNLFIDSDGSLKCECFDSLSIEDVLPEDEILESYYEIFSNPKSQKVEYCEFKNNINKKLTNLYPDNNIDDLHDLQIISFDNFVIVYDDEYIAVPNWFGVNIIDKDKLGVVQVTAEKFLDYINN